MKIKILIACSAVILIAAIVCSTIFFSPDVSRVDPLYEQVISALDSKEGIKELLIDKTLEEKADVIDEKIAEAYEYYQGKSVEIKDYKIYRESLSYYRASAVVVTDKGEYFVSAALSGARRVDPLGVKQVIIDNRGKHNKKGFFKAEKFKEYLSKSTEYGISLR